MRRYVKLSPRFWTGELGRLVQGNLDLAGFAAYLISSPHSNITGLYKLPIGYVSEDLGVSPQKIRRYFQQLSAVDFCEFDEETKRVWVIDALRHELDDKDLAEQDNRLKAIQSNLDDSKCSYLAAKLAAHYSIPWQAPSQDPPQAPSQDPSSQRTENREQRTENREQRAEAGAPSQEAPSMPLELDTPEFQAKWQEWLDYRRTYKKAVTPAGAKTSLKQLAEFGPDIAIATIDNSIANDWQGLFPEKLKHGRSSRKTEAQVNRSFGSDDARRKQIAEMEKEWTRKAEEEEANAEDIQANA